MFHCSVINVLSENFPSNAASAVCQDAFPWFCLATALIFYHVVFALSRTFFKFFISQFLASAATLIVYHVILHLSRTFFNLNKSDFPFLQALTFSSRPIGIMLKPLQTELLNNTITKTSCQLFSLFFYFQNSLPFTVMIPQEHCVPQTGVCPPTDTGLLLEIPEQPALDHADTSYLCSPGSPAIQPPSTKQFPRVCLQISC